MTYVEIDGIQIDSKIFTAKFCCDYEKCKGACCYQHIPGVELNGGALSDYDAAEILYHRRALSLLCDKDDQQVALEQPVSKDGGNFYTTLRKEKCVFSSMCKGTCVLKIAKDNKIADIDIPLSCQLYPIVWEVYPTYERLRVENIYDEILKASQALDEAEVPETQRALLVTPTTYKLMKQSSDITMETDIGEDMRLKGVISNLDGANVIKVPASRLPEKFGFLLAHPSATVSPVKLEEYKVHEDPPGISGSLVEGRICYDAFVLDNKTKALYYQATT